MLVEVRGSDVGEGQWGGVLMLVEVRRRGPDAGGSIIVPKL